MLKPLVEDVKEKIANVNFEMVTIPEKNMEIAKTEILKFLDDFAVAF